MNLRSGMFVIVAATLSLGTATTAAPGLPAAHRCACCAEPGTWVQETRRITPEEFAEIGRMNLSAAASLFVGPAGLGVVKGISGPSETYRLVHRRPTRDWRVELADDAGQRGELRFTIPDRATFFFSDPQDGRAAAAGGPVLVQEVRMTGPLVGTGAFKSGTFRLILQGRGNMCADADGFTSWILQVSGPGVEYSLFGKLDRPRPRAGRS